EAGAFTAAAPPGEAAVVVFPARSGMGAAGGLGAGAGLAAGMAVACGVAAGLAPVAGALAECPAAGAPVLTAAAVASPAGGTIVGVTGFVSSGIFFNFSRGPTPASCAFRSEEHTSELQSLRHLVCR